MSDNWCFDVTAHGSEALAHVLAIALLNHSRVAHYSVTPIKDEEGNESVLSLVFYWADPGSQVARPLPFPLGIDSMTAFVMNWLAQATYPPQPDHDGDNEKGWRVFCDDWGHVNDHWQALLAVQPCWAMHGK